MFNRPRRILRFTVMNPYPKRPDQHAKGFVSNDLALLLGARDLLDRTREVARRIEDRDRELTPVSGNDLHTGDTARNA